MRKSTISLTALVLFSAIGSVKAQEATGDAKRGQHLFMTVGCYECHGTVGQGSVVGARLAPDPLPASAMMQYIRKPAGAMPPYVEAVLGDQDVRDIQAYLASLPQPRALKDIPLLAR